MLFVLAALFGFVGCSQTGPAVVKSGRQATQAKRDNDTAAGPLTLRQRRQLSQSDRLRWLERNGKVPEDADQKDWELAGQTSWWGRPLDPKAFWKGRIIWCDDSARSAAAVCGRDWPPIPYDEETLGRLYPELARMYPSEGGSIWSQPGLEGPARSRGGATTEREVAFWTKFIMTHPYPPEELAQAQWRSSERYLKLLRRQNVDSDHLSRRTSEEVSQAQDSENHRMVKLGYPPEMLSEEALLWTYVVQQRRKYQDLVAAGNSTESVSMKAFVDRLLVDQRYVKDPFFESQYQKADAWKFAYLQRLRREKVDEAYINAYLKAWNLTSAQVFGAN